MDDNKVVHTVATKLVADILNTIPFAAVIPIVLMASRRSFIMPDMDDDGHITRDSWVKYFEAIFAEQPEYANDIVGTVVHDCVAHTDAIRGQLEAIIRSTHVYVVKK